MYALLPELVERHEVDLVIANGENAAGGVGLTVRTAKEMLKRGVHIITSGNHVWKYKEMLPLLDREPRILRPLNYPEGAPGRGANVFDLPSGHKVAVINLLGRAFMDPMPCPFRAVERAVQQLREQTPIIVVDFHAEATSEKVAMGYYCAGRRVSALIGTHTHIPTADERVLKGWTAYITDIGMTGGSESVLGRSIEPVLKNFTTRLPAYFTVSGVNPVLEGAIVEIDTETGKAMAIRRVRKESKE